jgi:hypothetical protein
MFTRVMKARKITVHVSVLLADLRVYTMASKSVRQTLSLSLLDTFYDECAAAILGVRRSSKQNHRKSSCAVRLPA